MCVMAATPSESISWWRKHPKWFGGSECSVGRRLWHEPYRYIYSTGTARMMMMMMMVDDGDDDDDDNVTFINIIMPA